MRNSQESMLYTKLAVVDLLTTRFKLDYPEIGEILAKEGHLHNITFFFKSDRLWGSGEYLHELKKQLIEEYKILDANKIKSLNSKPEIEHLCAELIKYYAESRGCNRDTALIELLKTRTWRDINNNSKDYANKPFRNVVSELEYELLGNDAKRKSKACELLKFYKIEYDNSYNAAMKKLDREEAKKLILNGESLPNDLEKRLLEYKREEESNDVKRLRYKVDILESLIRNIADGKVSEEDTRLIKKYKSRAWCKSESPKLSKTIDSSVSKGHSRAIIRSEPK